MTKLKREAGRDLVVYGHGLLGQTLLKHYLLDELRVSIFPVLVGRDKPLFREDETATLKLLATTTLPTGVVVLRYEPAVPTNPSWASAEVDVSVGTRYNDP
ncbi:MAG: dihydrofolate reductase [Candidatus Eremiobacteraeota bacterium]|nr:dihydrofolate reductase [Candidatus Eremiobacteraeota bacterium]